MRVSPFETLRWKVKSSDMEHRYLVDLLQNHGRGQCDCKWGATHHGPLAKRNDPKADECRCRHIKESRQSLAAWLIRHLAGKGLLTYSSGPITVDLEQESCTACGRDCEHISEAKEDLVSRYVKSVLREHGNEFDH